MIGLVLKIDPDLFLPLVFVAYEKYISSQRASCSNPNQKLMVRGYVSVHILVLGASTPLALPDDL